jgi:hypothetical protein
MGLMPQQGRFGNWARGVGRGGCSDGEGPLFLW